MRRGLVVAVAWGAVLFGTAPSARAACEVPKGFATSVAQLQYATDLFTGKLGESLATPANTANLLGGNVTRTSAYLAAVARFAQALPANLPKC